MFMQERGANSAGPSIERSLKIGSYFSPRLWAIAYVEELFWNRGVWHEKQWLFGADWELGWAKMYLVPLLAIPQITHYVLDGFIWRRKNNPDFRL